MNPKSTSNQLSKPCTVLQYPSKKARREGVARCVHGVENAGRQRDATLEKEDGGGGAVACTNSQKSAA